MSGIYAFIFVTSWFGWTAMELWIKIRERGQVVTVQDKRTRRIFQVLVMLAVVIGVYFSSFENYKFLISPNLRILLGSIIIWSGIILRIWSVNTLGKFFRTTVMIQKNHMVIQTGPYKFLRHPSYTGVILLVSGLGIALGSIPGLILMELCVWGAILQRINLEEKTLNNSFGKEYVNYTKHTNRVIPFLY